MPYAIPTPPNRPETTEETKQAVISYFKEQGLELYNVEGINKVYADLAEAKKLVKKSLRRLNIYDDLNLINEINEFLNK